MDAENSQLVDTSSASTSWHTVPSTPHYETRNLRDHPPHIHHRAPSSHGSSDQRRSITRIHRPTQPRVLPSHNKHIPVKAEHESDPGSSSDSSPSTEDTLTGSSRHSMSTSRSHESSRRHSKSHSRKHVSNQCDYTPLIKRETLAGLPPWPSDLKLSLTAGNWLEWSRHLMLSLAMTQLDEYPLGLLKCPAERSDPIGHRYWNGNDRMILAFMQTHMFSAESQHIATCTTSADAFRSLCRRHEKRSELTQFQLIQRLMQISFDDNVEHFETKMATFRDLVYQIESIGQVDVNRLGLYFLLLNLKCSHPTVHDALAPALMDGTVSVELMEERMHYYFEMRNAHQNQPYLPRLPFL